MNNKKLKRLIESKNLTMDEVELLPGYTRMQLGLPAVIPQVDYNFGQRIVENYLGRFQTLRTMFGLDDVVDIEPPFEFKEPDMGGNYCFTGDTEIPLVDGTTKTIKELAGLGVDSKFLVYSVDSSHRIVPKKAFAFKSGENADLVEVMLDDGQTARCTPDHLWMLRDGSYRKAKDLKDGDSLMPFYTRCATKEKKKLNHKVASVTALIEKEDVYDLTVEDTHNFALSIGVFVHNSWYNAQMQFELNRRCLAGETEVLLLDGTSSTMKELYENNKTTHKDFWVYSYDLSTKRMAPGRCVKVWENGVKKLVKVILDDGTQYRCTADHRWLTKTGKYVEAQDLYPGIGVMPTYFGVDPLYSDNFQKYWSDSENQRKQAERIKSQWVERRNPKVVCVEPCGEDVTYDLSIDTYHNFAIGSGVFVHNSVYHLVEEMDNYDVISAALDVYAEEATQTDEQTNRSVWIESEDSSIQKDLMSMMDRLGIEDNLFSIARSMCKYGDDFEQVIASPTQGIVSLQFINPNRLTRIEDRLGKLIGFAPGIHTDGQIHDERTIAKLRKSKPWDFIHFRLKSSRRETKHGETMLMAARRCVTGDTLVYTNEGPIPIKDIVPGEHTAIAFDRANGESRETEITCLMNNGVKPVFEVSTRHRSIKATADHPILVKTSQGEYVYKEVKDLVASEGSGGWGANQADELVLPVQPWGASTYKIQLNPDDFQVRLREPVETSTGVLKQLSELDLSCSSKRSHSFLRANKGTGDVGSVFSVSYRDYKVLSEYFDLPENVDIRARNSKHSMPVGNDLTFTVDSDVCYLLGFMLGGGWVEENFVGFALGEDEELNDRVASLFEERLSAPCPTHSPAKKGVRGGALQYNSMGLAHMFRAMGFITGFASKVVPSWVFSMNTECRLQLVKGLLDADGSFDAKHGGYRITLANKKLIEDLMCLCHGLGLPTSKKLVEILKEDRQPAYRVWVGSLEPSSTFTTENVCHVTSCGEETVYDIEVADDEHNFVSNGIVIHNCWRQLKLLEDMLVLHRINRAADKDIYYIDVGTQSPAQQWQTVNRFIRELNRKFHVNTQTGQFRQEYWTRSVDEDVYLPIPRDGNTRVDRLQGANTADQIYDVDHFRNKLFAALKIPKAFLGFEESVSNKATLVSQDIRFARSIKRVQRSLKTGFQQLCRIHLALKGHDVVNSDGTDNLRFRVNMSSINHIEQIARSETAQLQVDIATNLLTMATLGQGMDPETGAQTPGMIENVKDWTGWVLSRYMGLTDNEVDMFLPGAKVREPERQVIRDIQDNLKETGVSARLRTLKEAKDLIAETEAEEAMDAFEPYSGAEPLTKTSITKSWSHKGWQKSESDEGPNFYDLEEEKKLLAESLKEEPTHIPDCPSCGAKLTQKMDEATDKPYFICSKHCGFIAFAETPYDT